MATRILIADDDNDFRSSLKEYLSQFDYELYEAGSCMEVLRVLKKRGIDLILLDLQLGAGDGIELLTKIKNIGENLEVIMVTGYGSIEMAVKAMQHGVCDFVTKPFNQEDLHTRIEKALELLHLKLEQEHHRQTIPVLGTSQLIKTTLDQSNRLAKTNTTILITGETGTGKEVFARHIHYNSARASEAFVVINCANLSGEMLEDELFGHEPGAYTGANQQRRGKVTLADKGTLFLDEVGEVPVELQAKLLRFLEDKTYYRVGGDIECKADVRIIAATNRDLLKRIKTGRFREDLYYRLNIFPIELPPLRERPEDIPDLIYYYLESNASISSLALQKRFIVTEKAMKLFCQYAWPGNIRELKNVIERIIILSSDNETIGEEHLPSEFKTTGTASILKTMKRRSYKAALKEMAKAVVYDALVQADWNQTLAAENLGIDRTTIIKVIKEHSLKK